MQYRQNPYRKDEEPKVIAISKAQTVHSTTLLWQVGLAVVAYLWVTLPLQ